MKRQARPFVVETKRSRKAPTNLWASTPLLQEELAAATVAETKADAIFGDRSAKEKLRAAEPARRILPSLIVEAPPPDPVEIEEPATRRRAARDGAETADRPKRGRPRRTPAETAEAPSFAPAPSLTARTSPAHGSTEHRAAERKPARAAGRKPELARAETPKAGVAGPGLARAERARPAPDALGRAESAAPVRSSAPTGERPTPRTRAAKPDTAALPPGQRWKRRLPQLLW